MSYDRVRVPTRRRFLAGLAVAGASASGVDAVLPGIDTAAGSGRRDGAGSTAELTSRYDWPMFGQDSVNSSRTVSNGPEDGVERGWTSGVSASTPPAVVGGLVYLGTREGLVTLETDSGESDWRVGTPSSVTTPPTVVDDTVYVGTEDGTVHAYRATGGEQLWRFDAGGTAGPPPAVDPDRDCLYVATGDGSVYGLDARSGQVIWERSLDGTVEAALAVLPATETVYVPISGTVRGLDFTNGSDRWTFEAEGSTVSAPAVGSPHLFVADDGGLLYEVDPKSGERRWSETVSGSVSGAVAYLNDEVYAATDTGHVYAFDTDVSRNDDTASEEWHVELDGGVTTAPALSQGANTFYVPTEAGRVVALDPSEGDERWSARLSVGAPSIAVSDGSLFAVGDGVATLDPGSKTRITTEVPAPGPTPAPTATPVVTSTGTPPGTPVPTSTAVTSRETTPEGTAGTSTVEPPASPGSTPTPSRSRPASPGDARTTGGTPTVTVADERAGTSTTATPTGDTTTTGASGSLPAWIALAGVGVLAGLGALSADDRERIDTE